MKIKMLTSMAAVDFSLAFGEIADLPDATATAWIEAGIAAPVVETAPEAVTDPEPEPVREAVVAAPEVATPRRRKAK